MAHGHNLKTSDHHAQGMFTYLNSNNILNGIVLGRLETRINDVTELQVRLPVSILLCFLKTNRNNYILHPETDVRTSGNPDYCLMERFKNNDIDQKIGMFSVMPFIHYQERKEPLDFIKIHNSDRTCQILAVEENVQFARLFADIADCELTLETKPERYYLLQKLLFTVEMDETMEHIKHFKRLFNRHMANCPNDDIVSMHNWSRQFFSVRQDELLMTYKSGSNFTEEVMNDIHLFIHTMQSSYNTLFGVLYGVTRLQTLTHMFFDQQWFHTDNNKNLFFKVKADVRLNFIHDPDEDDPAWSHDIVKLCNIITTYTIEENA